MKHVISGTKGISSSQTTYKVWKIWNIATNLNFDSCTENHLTFPDFNCLICKKGMIMFASQSCCENHMWDARERGTFTKLLMPHKVGGSYWERELEKAGSPGTYLYGPDRLHATMKHSNFRSFQKFTAMERKHKMKNKNALTMDNWQILFFGDHLKGFTSREKQWAWREKWTAYLFMNVMN